jgi:hypothetical protein
MAHQQQTPQEPLKTPLLKTPLNTYSIMSSAYSINMQGSTNKNKPIFTRIENCYY